ncbi:MAG TPA: hypothetical protein VK812_19310 [Candidatus Binatus sp.]|nr:hypothetical protein [Candidatus Binatus sp.]
MTMLLNHKNRVPRLLLTSLLIAATAGGSAKAQSPPTGWVIYPMPESNSSVMQCANHSELEWQVSLSEAGTARIVPHPTTHGAGSPKLPAGVKRQKGMIGVESTFKLQNGWLLGFDAGEFGGGLWFAGGDGKTQELSNQNVHGFVETQQGVLVFVGLSHMFHDSGKVLIVPYKITSQTDLRTLVELDGAPEAVSKLSDDTALVITTQGISQISSSGLTKTLLRRGFGGLYPNSIVPASDSAIYAGMRLFVVRLVPQSGEYTEQWLVPDDRKHFRVRDQQCVCKK